MSILERLLPREANNEYRGSRVALYALSKSAFGHVLFHHHRGDLPYDCGKYSSVDGGLLPSDATRTDHELAASGPRPDHVRPFAQSPTYGPSRRVTV